MVLLAVGFAVVGGVSGLLPLPGITLLLGNPAFIVLPFGATPICAWRLGCVGVAGAACPLFPCPAAEDVVSVLPLAAKAALPIPSNAGTV